MGLALSAFKDKEPISSNSTSKALAIASMKVPAPAAHLALTTKSSIIPFSSHFTARASSAPTSITVLAEEKK
jgi:hypothetical protein